MIGMTFETDNLRSQIVFLWRVEFAGGMEEWVQIESPIAELESVNLDHALRAVGHTVCGGLAANEGYLTFRHSVPLLNLDINEFERPLTLVVSTADELERTPTGGDKF